MEDRADQSFGLAQRQTKNGAQHQRCRDRQVGIVWLAARRGAGRRPPARDRLVGKPDREAATPAQGGVILSPAGHPSLRPGNVMPAAGIGLVGHGKRTQAAEPAPLPTGSPTSMQHAVVQVSSQLLRAQVSLSKIQYIIVK